MASSSICRVVNSPREASSRHGTYVADRLAEMDRVRSKPLCICVCVRALTEATPRVNVRTIALSGCFTHRRLRRHRLNCIVMRVCMYVRRDGKLARSKSIRNVDNGALEGTCFPFFLFNTVTGELAKQ